MLFSGTVPSTTTFPRLLIVWFLPFLVSQIWSANLTTNLSLAFYCFRNQFLGKWRVCYSVRILGWVGRSQSRILVGVHVRSKEKRSQASECRILQEQKRSLKYHVYFFCRRMASLRAVSIVGNCFYCANWYSVNQVFSVWTCTQLLKKFMENADLIFKKLISVSVRL